ncbi:class I SAM-dependent methyltransferase [Streptomyces sp. NPDC048442]|uniref:class I SAM-dependent methyltransferase n=1 Tax=Streptomyces sp. NPDC048442 TaxID=3154823 RepID=UPI00343BC244
MTETTGKTETTATAETTGTPGHAHTATTDAEFWDNRYSESDRIWSGNPNPVLVREVTDLAPGRALDLGCGEGADTVWLARQGWQVTATDISRVALGRAAEHAAEAGVAERTDFQWHRLGDSFPAGTFDLVSAQFLHSEADLPRREILRTAAAAVAPGGTLLIVGHAGWASWQQENPPLADVHFDTPDELVTALELGDGGWELLITAEQERIQNAPDGTPGTRTDNTVMARRLP